MIRIFEDNKERLKIRDENRDKITEYRDLVRSLVPSKFKIRYHPFRELGFTMATADRVAMDIEHEEVLFITCTKDLQNLIDERLSFLDSFDDKDLTE